DFFRTCSKRVLSGHRNTRDEFSWSSRGCSWCSLASSSSTHIYRRQYRLSYKVSWVIPAHSPDERQFVTPANGFRWGLFGALLPEVLRFYKIVTTDQLLPHVGIAYCFVSMAFIVAAGFFTVAWKPENEFKAIWVGISFPVLVATLLQTAPA